MILSSTMVNVAVPSIMGTYGVGQSEAQWMATAFLAAMTASQLLAAWFIAVFGRRTSFSVVMLVFMVILATVLRAGGRLPTCRIGLTFPLEMAGLSLRPAGNSVTSIAA